MAAARELAPRICVCKGYPRAAAEKKYNGSEGLYVPQDKPCEGQETQQKKNGAEVNPNARKQSEKEIGEEG